MGQANHEQRRSHQEENHHPSGQPRDRLQHHGLIGRSHAIQAVLGQIQQAAPSQTTVLICGEGGVGKRLVAETIHHNSPRAGKPLVKVTCAALPENVVESGLFGHEKGAFTGALTSRRGGFEAADGGTLFLDEIGDLSPATQIKVLQVLQEGQFERLGSHNPLRVDVRVLAATSRDIEHLVRAGRFREDLYYRLNLFPISVPPLRQRKTDILPLANHFVERCSQTHGKKEVPSLAPAAIQLLMNYAWPGNVRELENCIERAVLLSTEGVIDTPHLPPVVQRAEPVSMEAVLNAVEREMISDALTTSHGNMAAAARQLGLTDRMMGLRVCKHGIDLGQFKRLDPQP